MGAAARSGSSASGCAGTSSTPFRRLRSNTAFPRTADFNTGDNFGSALFDVTQRKGWRWSASDAFLKPVRGRANLSVVTGALVDRVLLEGRRAVGHRLPPWRPRSARRARAAKCCLQPARWGRRRSSSVAASAGECGCPRSGSRRCIDNDAVGGNLQDHLQLRCAWRVSGVSTMNQRAASLIGKGLIGLEYILRRTGPMAMAPSQLGMFSKSDPRFATANLEYHVQPLSLEAFGGDLDPFPAFTASVCNLRPESCGRVDITSCDPAAPPAIRPNYLATEADRAVAAQAIRQARAIASQPALARYAPKKSVPARLWPTMMRRWPAPQAMSARRFSTRSARRRWAAWSMPNCG